MAFGNYNNNSNSSKGDKAPSVYSRYSFSNGKSNVDKTRLHTRFWNGSLVIGIAPRTPDSTDDNPVYDNRNGPAVYLNHSKARVFATVLRGFREDPAAYDNCGVNSGKALITISQGKEFGSTAPIIVIRQINEDGNVTSSFAYEMKQEWTFSVKGFDEKNPGNYDRVYYPNLELDQLITLLDEYVKAETRAVAYTVYDAMNFELARFHTKLNRIGEKLGLDLSFSSQDGGGATRSSGSFFNRNPGNSSSSSAGMADDFGGPQYTSATLDDIE